jgi:hypothetical protein
VSVSNVAVDREYRPTAAVMVLVRDDKDVDKERALQSMTRGCDSHAASCSATEAIGGEQNKSFQWNCTVSSSFGLLLLMLL